MSPTARTREYDSFTDDDFLVVGTTRLEASELQVLYGEDQDYACCTDDPEHQTEEDEEYEADDVSTLAPACRSAEDGRQRRRNYRRASDSHLRRNVVFSNEAYYSKLEELKRAHLRNVADLQKLYLSQMTCCQRDAALDTLMEETDSEQVAPSRRWNVGSQGQLADSDQPEASADDHVTEEWEDGRTNAHFEQQVHPTPPLELALQTKPHPLRSLTNRQPRQTSKVTVPRPFHMTLREEVRKLRRVKTRSEVELENERLRKELDELKECGKKFRATPAPASTHKPLHEVIVGKRATFRQNPEKGRVAETPGCRMALPLPQRPFSFIERERRKKERKLEAVLNAATPLEECRAFKARPMPKSIYRRCSQEFLLYGAIELREKERERKVRRGLSTAPPGGPEEVLQEEDEENDIFPPCDVQAICGRGREEKKRSVEKVEKEMKRRKNGDRERDWSYIHPLRGVSLCHNQELISGCTANYISV